MGGNHSEFCQTTKAHLDSVNSGFISKWLFKDKPVVSWIFVLYLFNPTFHPNLPPVWTLLLFILPQLTSSFAAVILTLATRSRCLSGNINIKAAFTVSLYDRFFEEDSLVRGYCVGSCKAVNKTYIQYISVVELSVWSARHLVGSLSWQEYNCEKNRIFWRVIVFLNVV